MPSLNDFKVANVGLFPLAGGVPAWKLNTPGNPWDALLDAIASTYADINGNTKNYSNLGNVTLASGKVFSAPGQVRSQASTTVAQSIPNAVFTTLSFDSNIFDVGGMHSTSVNPTRFTVPAGQGGSYLFVLNISFASLVPALYVKLKKNGTDVFAPSPGIGCFALGVSTIFELAAGDYIEAVVNQNFGSANNTLPGPTSVTAYKLG